MTIVTTNRQTPLIKAIDLFVGVPPTLRKGFVKTLPVINFVQGACVIWALIKNFRVLNILRR